MATRFGDMVRRAAVRPQVLGMTVMPLVLLFFALSALIAMPSLKWFGPLRPLYTRYSKWRYNWRSPDEMGDGKGVREILLEGPMGIAEDRFGDVFVSDRDARFVWRIAASGKTTIIAGTGLSSSAKTGIPARVQAREAAFGSPEGLAVDADGNLFLADSSLNVVFKIDRDGWRTIFAGSVQAGYAGDGGPATAAKLHAPYDIRLDAQGNLYIADVYNHAVRKVDHAGIITTIAGTGTAGFSGDNGPATQAQLSKPYGLLLDTEEYLFIADSENNRIRKLGRDGVITTIAGTGTAGFSGDNGPALAAQFNVPQSLAQDAQGRLYIGDEHNHALRAIEPNGTVRTIIGNHGHGYAGDGGLATAAQIADPENLLVRRDGSLLITARDNARVRIITTDGKINTWAGSGPSAKHEYQP
jgi:trimeric autotransporter adhesin